jgi:hypothetical protein
MRQYLLLPTAMLLMAFIFVSCKRTSAQNAASMPLVTSNLVSEVKIKTGLDLPKSCRLIMTTNYSRLDSDIWIIGIDGTNQPQFPKELHLQPSDAGPGQELMERTVGFSIGMSLERYYGVWEVSNAQCHATLITTTNGGYLILELLH